MAIEYTKSGQKSKLKNVIKKFVLAWKFSHLLPCSCNFFVQVFYVKKKFQAVLLILIDDIDDIDIDPLHIRPELRPACRSLAGLHPPKSIDIDSKSRSRGTKGL
jgi:hypothetical protein